MQERHQKQQKSLAKAHKRLEQAQLEARSDQQALCHSFDQQLELLRRKNGVLVEQLRAAKDELKLLRQQQRQRQQEQQPPEPVALSAAPPTPTPAPAPTPQPMPPTPASDAIEGRESPRSTRSKFPPIACLFYDDSIGEYLVRYQSVADQADTTAASRSIAPSSAPSVGHKRRRRTEAEA